MQGSLGLPKHSQVVATPWTLRITASTADQHILIAFDRDIVLVAAAFTVTTAGTGTLDLKRCTSGTAPASGTSVLTTAFDVSTGTGNTPITMSPLGSDIARTIHKGETLALDVSSLSTIVGDMTIWYAH